MADEHTPGRPAAAVPDQPAATDWHAARLASTIFSVGRLGHDLRGFLSPALLAAERLQAHADPAVRRSAETVLRAVDRAAAALRDTLRDLRDGAGWQPLAPVSLRAAIGPRDDLAVVNLIPPDATVIGDPDALARAFDGFISCLRRQGAGTLRVEAECEAFVWTVRLRCELPPGWPDDFAAAAATPCSDLAIAGEWLRSCDAEMPAAEPDGLCLALRAR